MQLIINISFFCDKELLTSIFQNLLDNAIKYRTESSYVKISVKDEDKGVEIKVEDNGIGIPKSIHEKVFDMFFRANLSSKGSGLGLYLVKTSVEKLGGKMQLLSQENKGTCIIVLLPSLEKKSKREYAGNFN